MRTLALILFAFCFLVTGRNAFALEVPKLTAHVNDYADLLPAAEEQRVDGELLAYEQKTGHQFAVLTIDTLDGDSLEDFSIRVVESWKLGRAKKDDGLLLLVVKRERKARIEVGYGLEGAIPDAVAARVVRNVMVPAFRQGDYPGGVSAALSLLMKAAEGENVKLPPDPKAVSAPAPPSWAILLFALGAPLIVTLLALSRGGRRGGMWSGGLGSGSLRRGGYWGGGFGGYGGSRGGGFGGGGFGGGGFGGGGGGFGGGGASGSW